MKVFLTLAVIGIMFFAAYIRFNQIVDGRYVKIDNRVYWRYFHHWKMSNREVKGADAKSFHAFFYPKGIYGKDRDHVFHEGRMLKDASPKTFKIVNLEEGLGKDGDNEYKNNRKVKNNADQFEKIGHFYAKDINGIYWFDELIEGGDFESFELIGSSWEIGLKSGSSTYAKDENQVYCNGEVILDADPSTFELIGGDYAKDHEMVFYEKYVLRGVDPDSFKFCYHDRYYMVGDDGDQLYSLGVPVKQ